MKNAEFYTRVRDTQPIGDKKRDKVKWKQLLQIGALFIFFAAFIPSKRGSHFPTDWYDYLAQTGLAFVFVSVILMIIFWNDMIKPYLRKNYRFKFEGVFEVREKIAKPKKRISLYPGTDHLVSVDNELFQQLSIGDKVHVQRQTTGEVIAIRKKE